MKKLLIIILAFCLFPPYINGQDFVSTAKVKDGLLHIKIFPKSLKAYEAYRYNGLTCYVSTGDEVVKTVSLKPEDDSEWILKSETNKGVRIAYDLLKHKDSNINPSSLADYIKADKSLRYSHGFYTILSSLDKEASQLSGLAFSIPMTSEQVMLEIKNAINDDLNTTLAIHPENLSYQNKSPEILGFNFDHAVKIAWDHEEYFQQVLAYKIQKKGENGKFVDLDIPPKLYTTQSQDDPLLAYKMLHVDSLANNYEDEVYRIVGIDNFGDRMEASNEVVLHGRDLTPPTAPNNFTANFSENKAELTWGKVDEEVDRILILRSINGEAGPFEKTQEDFISPKELSYTDEILDVNKTYYYLMLVADSAGNVAQSFPTYLDIPDIYPPNNPTELRTHIDSTGHVTLMWQHSDNNDIRGYKIFRAENRNHEFIQISKGTTPSNVFYDKLSLQMNNPNAYYYVKALDKSFNNSLPSDTIEVLRPDIIAPSAPILRRAFVENNKINLAWIPSSSKDVSHYLIMADTGSGWWEQSRCSAEINQFSVPLLSDQKVISYKITSEDEMGNRSSKEAGKRIFIDKTKDEELFFELANSDGMVSISWGEITSSKSIMVYRSSDGEKFSMLRRINGDILSFNDKSVKKGERYHYKIIKENDNGTRSAMSLAQEIKVK